MKVLQLARRKMAEWVVGNLRLVDPRLYEALGQWDHGSNRHVTIDSAMQLSAVWSCVRLISETIATLPLPVYRKDERGRKTPANDHILYPILHDQPNANMTAAEFWEAMVSCVCLWGNAYALKGLTRAGRLVSLEPLRPDRMTVTYRRNGAVVFRYRDPDKNGDLVEYSEDEIFHLKGFGTSGLMGLSPITYARLSLGNAMSVEESVGATFNNMIRPAGVLTTDQVMKQSAADALGDKLAEKFQGTVNAGKVMVLQGGFKFQPVSLPPEDAQMLQTRGFNIEEICRWFRVPPFMIGHNEKVTSWGTGIEQQMIAFMAFALRPYLTRIEQAVRKSLISPIEQRTISAEFNLEGLLRADSQGRAALYSQMAQNGIYTRNEIRAKENLPPLPGGDVLTVQVNLVPIDLLGKLPTPANQSAQQEAVPT